MHGLGLSPTSGIISVQVHQNQLYQEGITHREEPELVKPGVWLVVILKDICSRTQLCQRAQQQQPGSTHVDPEVLREGKRKDRKEYETNKKGPDISAGASGNPRMYRCLGVYISPKGKLLFLMYILKEKCVNNFRVKT